MPARNIIKADIPLCNMKEFESYWDDFIAYDWFDNISANLRAIPSMIPLRMAFIRSGWPAYPRHSWQKLPEPFFGNIGTKSEFPIKTKGVFINLNPKCSTNDENSFNYYTQFVGNIPPKFWYYGNIYRTGRSYSTLNQQILNDTKNETNKWMHKNRVQWLSEILYGRNEKLSVQDILTFELIPWSSAGWKVIEKDYALQSCELILNKIFYPAIYATNNLIDQKEITKGIVLCRGVDIVHTIRKLQNGYPKNILELTPSNKLLDGCGYKCHLFELKFDCVGTAIFMIFKGPRGVSLPPNKPCWDLTSFGLPSSNATTAELIKDIRQIVDFLKHQIRGEILASELGIG